MNPIDFLFELLFATAVAAAMQRLATARRRRALARLAQTLNMQYVAVDRFNLAARTCGILPFPGAASLRVFDVIYETSGARRRHLYTCEFGQGTIHSQFRRRCVAGFEEPVTSDGPIENLIVAPESLSLVEQYRWAREQTPQFASPANSA
jgi:hypothetical protein